MSAVSATGGSFAKSGGAKTCTDFPETCTVSALQIAITNIIRAKYPQKTWAFVGDMLGLKERSAKHRLSNSRAYTVEELQVLIQSEDGFDFLNALMADAEPKWWWWAKRVMATAERRRQAAELDQEILKLETSRPAETGARRRIKGDMDANKNIGSKFARAETTLGLLAPNVDRVADRGMAQAQTKATPRAYAGRGR